MALNINLSLIKWDLLHHRMKVCTERNSPTSYAKYFYYYYYFKKKRGVWVVVFLRSY